MTDARAAKAINRAYANSMDRILGLQMQADGVITKKYALGEREFEWNYREIASNEIVMDIDYDSLDKKDVGCVVAVACEVFEAESIGYELYDTGGKGYHFHFFFDDLPAYPPDARSMIRKYFLLIYGHGMAVDYAKKDENTMIGIEWARHRKGGQKVMLKQFRGGRNVNLPVVVRARLQLRDVQMKVLWGSKHNYNDFERITPQGLTQKKPCIEELRRRSKEYNINRHSTALLLCSALRGEGMVRDEVIAEVQRYMDGVNYTDQDAAYLYEHSYCGVSCNTIRDVLIGTGATQKCKNCQNNPEYREATK